MSAVAAKMTMLASNFKQMYAAVVVSMKETSRELALLRLEKLERLKQDEKEAEPKEPSASEMEVELQETGDRREEAQGGRGIFRGRPAGEGCEGS